MASVASHAGSTYAWIVTNGSITAGAGTPWITFAAGGAGTPLSLSVTETNGGCASGPGNASVTVVGGASTSAFHSLSPCRVLDTRNPAGPLGSPSLASNQTRTFAFAGVCGIPAGATAVSGNVTVVTPAAAGDLRVFRGDISAPLATHINFNPGRTRANNGMLALSHDAQLSLAIQNESAGSVDVIVDVNGYFQ
jgi:hypothetical protein